MDILAEQLQLLLSEVIQSQFILKKLRELENLLCSGLSTACSDLQVGMALTVAI